MPVERDSQTWRAVNTYVTDRLGALTMQLETDLDALQTARLRGQIRELRDLLGLDLDEDAVAPLAPSHLGSNPY